MIPLLGYRVIVSAFVGATVTVLSGVFITLGSFEVESFGFPLPYYSREYLIGGCAPCNSFSALGSAAAFAVDYAFWFGLAYLTASIARQAWLGRARQVGISAFLGLAATALSQLVVVYSNVDPLGRTENVLMGLPLPFNNRYYGQTYFDPYLAVLDYVFWMGFFYGALVLNQRRRAVPDVGLNVKVKGQITKASGGNT